MLPISPIRSLLPSSNIKGIILDDPEQINDSVSAGNSVFFSPGGQGLSIKVKTTSITTADNKDMSQENSQSGAFASIPNFNFNDHLRVCVIQSRHPELTKVLQTMGERLTKFIGPLNQWKGNDKFNDMIYSNILNKAGNADKKEISDFKNNFMKIQTKKLFGDIKSPLFEKSDSEGKQIRSVPINFDFHIEQLNPSHLAYFILPYMDFSSIISALGTTTTSPEKEGNSIGLGLRASDFEKIGNFLSPVNYDIVFKDGRVSKESFFYKTPDGKVWTGPVHRADGSYMTGNGPSFDSVVLQAEQTKNVKIQDFRNRKGMMTVGIMSDFQDDAATVRNVLAQLQPKDKSLNPANNAKDPYISDLFLSIGTRKSSKFMFLVNMNDLVSNNSLYGKLIKTSRASIRSEIFNNSVIKSLKIYRQTVKKVVGANELGGEVEKYMEQDDAPVLVTSTFQHRGKNSIEPTSNLTEEMNMPFLDAGIRSFNVDDRDFSSADRSQHQYRIEIQIIDGTLDYFRTEIRKLRAFINVLENYESDILNSTIRPENEEREDPHTAGNLRSLSRSRTVGGYDFRFGNLTENFAIKMKNKYATDIQSGIASFIKLLRIFSRDEDFNTSQETNLKNFLGLITSPNATAPNSVSSVIQLLQDSTAKISSFVGQNTRMTDPVEKKSDFIVGFGESVFATPGVIRIDKKFKNILDLSLQGRGGYDYLSINTGQSSQDSSNQTGLKALGGKNYRERITMETLKYYISSQPNLTEGLTAQSIKFAGGDSATNSSFSFLSPSIVRFNEIPIDILNAGRIENPLLMKVIESKIVLDKSQSENNGEVPVYDFDFRKNSFLAARQNVRAQQVAPATQQKYISDYYNLIPTSPKLIPLSENRNARGTGIVTEQDEILSSMVAVPELPSMHPSSFIQKVLSRTLDATIASEEKNADLFDLNEQQNFLRGAAQSEVVKLPNQVKALFISLTTGNGGDVRFRPQIRKNVFEDPDHSASSTMKYKLLTEVQYLDSFSSTGTENISSLLMTAPVFRTLDKDVFSKFTGRKILCRLRKFEIPEWGLIRPANMDTLIYDEYFTLEPDTPIAGADATAIVEVSQGVSAAGWGLTEEEYTLLSEFGTSFLPDSNSNLSSDALSETTAKLGLFSNSVFGDPAADAFNAPEPGAGSNFGSSTSLASLASLRAKLQEAQTVILALELGLETKQTARNGYIGKRDADLASIQGAIDDTSERVQRVRERIGGYGNQIDSLNREIEVVSGEIAQNKIIRTGILAEIRTETKRVEQSIIASQVGGGVFGECAFPSQILQPGATTSAVSRRSSCGT